MRRLEDDSKGNESQVLIRPFVDRKGTLRIVFDPSLLKKHVKSCQPQVTRGALLASFLIRRGYRGFQAISR
jgi:hypothetical protein